MCLVVVIMPSWAGGRPIVTMGIRRGVLAGVRKLAKPSFSSSEILTLEQEIVADHSNPSRRRRTETGQRVSHDRMN